MTGNLVWARVGLNKHIAQTIFLFINKKMEKTIVAVFAGSRDGNSPEYKKHAYTLGKELAHNNCHVLWGGGQNGVMGSLMNGVCDNDGTMGARIFEKWFSENELFPSGVISTSACKTENDRNEIFLRTDFQIAIAGGVGSLLEITYALNEKIYHQPKSPPLIILSSAGYWKKLGHLMSHMVKEGFNDPSIRSRYQIVTTPQNAIKAMKLKQ